MSETESKAKFRFDCTKCGKCCEDREPIPLALEDIDWWSKKNVIRNLFPYLRVKKDADKVLSLVMDTIHAEGAEETVDAPQDEPNPEEELEDLGGGKLVKGKCPMYGADTKTCLIWADRPLYCRAFPLGYDGESYYIQMDDCEGLNAEEMDKELLKEMREEAKRLTEGKRILGTTLPVLQAVIMNQLEALNRKAMEHLSSEDMEKLGSIFQKLNEQK
jgi:Fe-S-cluster containining protein